VPASIPPGCNISRLVNISRGSLTSQESVVDTLPYFTMDVNGVMLYKGGTVTRRTLVCSPV